MKYSERLQLNAAVDEAITNAVSMAFGGDKHVLALLEADRYRLPGGGIAYARKTESSAFSLLLVSNPIYADRKEYGGSIIVVSHFLKSGAAGMLEHLRFFEENATMTHASFLAEDMATGMNVKVSGLPSGVDENSNRPYYYLSNNNGIYASYQDDTGEGITFNPYVGIKEFKPILEELAENNIQNVLYHLNMSQLIYGEVHEKEAAFEWLINAEDPQNSLDFISQVGRLDYLPTRLINALLAEEISFEEAADTAFISGQTNQVESLLRALKENADESVAAFSAAVAKRNVNTGGNRPKVKL